MFDRALQERADRLAARVEALAVALQKSGVSDDAAARLLAHVSASAADEKPRARRDERLAA